MFADVLPWLRVGAVAPLSIGHWLGATARWLRQFACGVSGHDLMLRTSPTRIFLQCAACRHQSRGWQVDVRPCYRTALTVRERGRRPCL